MKPADLLRLSLSKALLLKAKGELNNANDEISLSTAIIHLHDSIDNLLSTAAGKLSTPLGRKTFMMDVYDAINTQQKVVLIAGNEVKQLNVMRNSLKHQGILPNQSQVIALLPILVDFINDLCQKVFSTQLEDISGAHLINNDAQRRVVRRIEKAIAEGDYEAAMEQSAKALFTYFDSTSIQFSELNMIVMGKDPAKQVNVFPERGRDEVRLRLIEHGVDPYLYHRFKNLTPAVGYKDLKTKKLILRHEDMFWHARNWTIENARFCLNFVTNLLIKMQRGYGGYTITEALGAYMVKTKRNTTLYDDNGNVKRKLKEGESFEAILSGYVNGEWEKYSRDYIEGLGRISAIVSDGEVDYVGGYIPVEDISIEDERRFVQKNY